MLQFEKSKKNGGFTLWGTYETLKGLHSFILDLSERSLVLEDQGLTLSLAYDIRKAYEGQRESDKTKIWDDELTIYGVEQVWPTFLTQVALLRTGLAFVDSTKQEQSQMYMLEDFTENIISESVAEYPTSYLKTPESAEPFLEKYFGALMNCGTQSTIFLEAIVWVVFYAQMTLPAIRGTR